jgi:ketosteroid isomerase-like protein
MGRGITIWLASAVLMAGCGEAGPGATPDGALALSDAHAGREVAAPPGVEAVIEALFDGVRAGDPDAVMAAYSRGDGFVYVGCTTARLGIEAMERMTAMYHGQAGARSATYELLSVRPVGADAAVVTARGSVGGAGSLHWTWVLEREAEGWRIAHEHESWPGCEAPSTHPAMEPPTG